MNELSVEWNGKVKGQMVQKMLYRPVLGCVIVNLRLRSQHDMRNDECLVVGAEASLLTFPLNPGFFLLDLFSSI